MAQNIQVCPNTPNCVSSHADEVSSKYVDPIPFSSLDEIQKKLEKAINEYGGTTFLKKEALYWHVVFTTSLLRFKDDVEFVFDTTKNQVMLRSASRVGHYDFGANRKRLSKLRAAIR